MARGWESKAVEAQQDDARRRTASAPPVAADVAERRARAQTVGLALADATAQLQAACRPAHRDALLQRIAGLRALLAELGGPEV